MTGVGECFLPPWGRGDGGSLFTRLVADRGWEGKVEVASCGPLWRKSRSCLAWIPGTPTPGTGGACRSGRPADPYWRLKPQPLLSLPVRELSSGLLVAHPGCPSVPFPRNPPPAASVVQVVRPAGVPVLALLALLLSAG